MKSDSASNIHYQYSRIKQSENVLNPYGRENLEKYNIGKVTKNTGLKKYSQRHVRDALKHHLGD